MTRALRQGVVDRRAETFAAAVACFDDDFDACIAHLRFPIAHREVIRTTVANLLERLFVEDRRRTKIIPNFFDGDTPRRRGRQRPSPLLTFPARSGLDR